MGKKLAAQTRPAGKPVAEGCWRVRLIGWYLAISAVYILLAFLLRRAPIVIIDEGLYTNIARSLAWEGKIAFRGQPVPYPYILYPLLLVPVYRLQALLGGDLYRWVQVFNVLVICTSVFPVYLFARDFSGDRRLAFLSAVIAALVPDMMMGLFEMSEAILWPLSLWTILFFWRMRSRAEEKTWPWLAGVFAGLMFFAKPGAVAMAGGILAMELILSLKAKDKGRLRRTLTAAGALLAVIVLVFALYSLVFGYGFSFLGLYNKQTSDWAASHGVLSVLASFLQVFLFVFACGGIFALLPYFRLGRYSSAQKDMLLAATLGLIAAEIGTAVFVVPYKWNGTMDDIQLHMRYCAMYIPVWFVFCTPLWPDGAQTAGEKKKPARRDTGLSIALGITALLSIFPGVRVGFPRGSSTINALSLSAFVPTARLNAGAAGWIATVATVVLLIFLLMTLSTPARRRMDFCAAVFGVLLLFHGVCAATNIHVPIAREVEEDAQELEKLLEASPGEKLGVCPRYYDDVYIYWQESRLSRPMQQVTIDQMYVETQANGGVYRPFVPMDQAPNEGNLSTPEAEYLVLGQSIAPHLELNDSVSPVDTANDIYTLVRLTPGQRWVDTMLYGMDEDILRQDVVGELCRFDGLEGPWELKMRVEGSAGAELTIYWDEGSQTVTLSGDRETFTVPVSGEMVHLQADRDIYLYSYETRAS